MSRKSAQLIQAKNARELAAQALLRVYGEGAYSNLALDGLLKRSELEPSEKKLAAAIFYGTLTETEACDELLTKLSSKPLRKLDLPVLVLLRQAVWQLYYSGQAPHAVVNETVKTVRRLGFSSAAGMVNACLRRALRDFPDYRPETPEGKSGFAAPLFKAFSAWLGNGEEVYRLGEAFRAHNGVFLRFRPGTEDPSVIKASLAAEGEIADAFFQPDGLYFKSGGKALESLAMWRKLAVTAQGEAAMLPAAFLKPEGEALVMDLCAAPGGKTLQLAEALGPGGRVVAGELHESRKALMDRQFQRFGLSNIETYQHDATLPWPRFRGEADYVLADVPCSGLGLLGSKPELRLGFDAARVKRELVPVQAAILDRAAELLKPGGLLLYSTCTLNPDENERQTESFLKRHPEFRPLPLTGRLPETEKRLLALDPALKDELSQGRLTLWPHRTKSEGFFLALMRKDLT